MPEQPYQQQPNQPYSQQGSPQPMPGGPGAGGYPQPTGQPWPPTPPEPVKKKRRKWPWVALAVLVLLVIIIGSSGKSGTPTPSVGGTAASAPAVPGSPAAPAAPAPASPAASAPTIYTGKGDDVVTIKKDSGPGIVTFECPRCSGNTVLQSDGRDSLLVNTIGSYSGRHLIDATDGSVTSTLTVKATGSWKITVASGLASAQRAESNANGHGDDVVLLTGKISKAAITNKGGNSNFVVQVYDSSGIPDLAVNTIGGYSSTVPIHGPAVLAITSNGDWTVTGS